MQLSVRMFLLFSADWTKIIFTNLSSIYTFTYFYLMSMCLVHDLLIMLLAMNMAPTLPTLTITGSFTEIFMLPNNLMINITSLTASDKATHSAYELDSFTIFWAFDSKRAKCKPTYASSTFRVSCIINIAETNNFPGFTWIPSWL